MKTKRHSDNAFTLVELLVVIAIIGILTALLLSALSSAEANSHSTKCKSLLRQIGLGLQMYLDDNKGKFPYYLSPSPDSGTQLGRGILWSAKLTPYYPLKWESRAYHCPAYKGAISLGIGSFAYNAFGVGRSGRSGSQQELGLGGYSFVSHKRELPTELQVQSPSEMFAVGESRWMNQGKDGTPGGNDFMFCGIQTVNRGGLAFDPARHGKNYNQLFSDGHVSAMSPWVLFNPTNTAMMWN